MSKLKAKVIEIVEIVKECPENLQTICFELLLKHELGSASASGKSPATEVTPKSKDVEPPSVDKKVLESQDDITESALHTKTRHLMQRVGITIEQINNLFYKEGDEIKPLYEDLKTTRMAECQIRIALLLCLKSGLTTGEFETTIKAVRDEATARKCYDGPNFAKNFTTSASLFDFEKYDKALEAIRISEEGKRELAKIVKEIE